MYCAACFVISQLGHSVCLCQRQSHC